MGYEQIDLDFNSEKKENKPNTIPYSETFQKDSESSADFIARGLELAKRKLRGEIIIEDPTPEEINDDLKLIQQEEKQIKPTQNKNAISSNSNDELESKIARMKSRKDLDY